MQHLCLFDTQGNFYAHMCIENDGYYQIFSLYMHLKEGIMVVNIYEFLPRISHFNQKAIQDERAIRRTSSQKDCVRI